MNIYSAFQKEFFYYKGGFFKLISIKFFLFIKIKNFLTFWPELSSEFDKRHAEVLLSFKNYSNSFVFFHVTLVYATVT